MVDIGHGVNSILVNLQEATSRITRSMNSSLKYLQSDEAGEWNCTSKREATSEKPEKDVMKPLAYQHSREANFLWEIRKYVLLQATLAASITYSAGLTPPGGFWPHNDNINNGGHLAGDPVLQVTYPRRYMVFFYCNATAFLASIVTINLLLVHSLSRRRWWLRALQAAMILNQLGLIGAYAAGSFREVAMSTYVIALVGMVSSYVCVCVLVLCFALWAVRARHGGSKSPTPEAPEASERARKDLLIFATLLVKPKLEESMPERLTKLFDLQTEEEDKEVKWNLEKSRKLLLLLATLSAVITYQAGMSPTGGFWQQNKTGHVVGNPVLQTSHDAFIASIFIVSSLRWWLWTLGMFCTIAAFGAARSQCTLAISGLFARDGGNKFQKLFGTSESEDHRDPALSDARETVDVDQLRQRSRKYLLLLAILAASITYQAGAKPPGGLRQANATDGHHYGAGDSVLHTTYHRRFVVCWNATAFMAYLVILILLLSNISRARGIKNCALQVAMILDLLGLIGAFPAGSCSKSKLAVDRDVLKNRPVKRNNRCEATWRVAAAAPHHMTGNQSLLLACAHNGRDDGEDIVVHPATKGEMPLRVQGSGSVRTESIALDDVWYVPGLDSNLVSTGQLVRQGCAISLGPGGCSITKGGALVGTARFTEACQFELDFLNGIGSI